MQPLIAIPYRNIHVSDKIPPSVGVRRAYIDALVKCGAAPIMVPHVSQPEALERILNCCQGLLLTGGEDIDPALYHEKPHPKLGAICAERDQIELTLVKLALARELPILGVCRGMQLLNVALGGTLWQDIHEQMPRSMPHAEPVKVSEWTELRHSVEILSGTKLAAILGAGTRKVNSLHHQAIKELAPGCVISARAPDGVIEGIEKPGRSFLLGVEWHPELLWQEVTPEELKLFQAFIEACAA
jgi:putative glutamine amidotransferase